MKAKRGWSLRDGLNALFRRIHILVVVLVLLPLGTLLACFLVSPVYETRAELRITTAAAGTGIPDAAPRRGSIAELKASPAEVTHVKEILQSRDLWIRTVKGLGSGFSTRKSGTTLNQRTEDLLERAAVGLGLKEPPGTRTAGQAEEDYAATAQRLSRNCLISPGPGSGILEVAFQYDDPEMARTILTTHVKECMREFPGGRPSRGSVEIPKAVEPERPKGREGAKDRSSVRRDTDRNPYQEEYERAGRRLAEYRRKWKLVFPEKQKEELYAEIAGMKETLRRLEGKISRAQQILDSLQASPVPTAKQILDIEGDELDRSSRESLSQLAEQIRAHEMIKAHYVETSRDFRDSRERVLAALARFKQLMEVDLAGMEVKRAAIEADISDKEDRKAKLEQRIGELRRLEVEEAVAKDRYVRFSVRRPVSPEIAAPSPSTAPAPAHAIERNAAQPQRALAVKLLSPPFLPDNPIFPRKGLYVLVSLILAVPLGLIMMAVANHFDRTFDTPEDVEEATGYKVLASFRRIKGPSRAVPSRRLHSNR